MLPPAPGAIQRSVRRAHPPIRWDGGPFLEAATLGGKRPRRQANQVSGYGGSALVTFDPYLGVDEPDMACVSGAPAAPITRARPSALRMPDSQRPWRRPNVSAPSGRL